MNMYVHELKALRKSTMLWTVVLIGLAVMYLSIYPGMAHDAKDFVRLLANYPPQIRAMLGINLSYITSILGFYSMIFSFIVLCGAIQGMNLGLSVLSKESREQTADFLLVKPVSRPAIVTAKLFASLTAILATYWIFYAAAILIANGVKTDNFDGKVFFLINLTLLFIQLIFFAVGMALSVLFGKLKTVLPLSLGVVIGFYLIGALINSGKNDPAVRYFSPFNYFNSAYIIRHSAYEAPYLITAAGIVVAAVLVTYIVYSKKDIHAVS
ncbi:ABC transporter permease subunit [Sporolactobacillus vineae]|uniref:ABC transporter permease subunit n=1 Tax=Sporolactobacillus vineae TaxID=444463 RepID=UPI000289B0FC|nr:ABC transporter permease subunit [Sporolactobacillus vineae]